jgi:quercetin dioxygenase-like cupin family protein
MNIKELHTPEKPVSASSLFKSDLGNATAIQILKGEQLQEHISKNPALLICVFGKAVFEDESGAKNTLRPGDYVEITSKVKHWVIGMMDSQLVLIK